MHLGTGRWTDGRTDILQFITLDILKSLIKKYEKIKC